MGQSVDSGFKATAVPTWGPRIPPAIGNSAVCLQNQLFVYINFAPCTLISCTYILAQNLDVSSLLLINVTTLLWSRNFQNVKLRLDFVEI